MQLFNRTCSIRPTFPHLTTGPRLTQSQQRGERLEVGMKSGSARYLLPQHQPDPALRQLIQRASLRAWEWSLLKGSVCAKKSKDRLDPLFIAIASRPVAAG